MMCNAKIAIIVTTIQRDELLFKCLRSIEKYWNKDYFLLVVDQGEHTEEKDKQWAGLKLEGEYIKTEYDIGPLKARNIAIKRAKELGIPFILMSADSILFDNDYDFNPIIEFLNTEKERFLCGFDIRDRLPWEADMVKKDRFLLDIPRRPAIKFSGQNFQPVDICRNFFLCKTEKLADSLYDEDRLMADHESSFWRWQQKGYKCFYNHNIQAAYVLFRPEDYDKLRSRLKEAKNQMMNKYKLAAWVRYSPDLVKFWNDWRKKSR